jgi:phosphoribosylformimino-5-aminoimidazole carboxamide ribotide isomerase
MLVIPSVDIRQGKSVRLIEGDPDRLIEYEGDPVEMSLLWEREGATCLHVVDLDGAFRGEPINLPIYSEIARSVSIPIEVGGGLRSLSDIEKVLNSGCRRAVISTAAFTKPGFLKKVRGLFGDRVVVSVDTRDLESTIEVSGWRTAAGVGLDDAVKELLDLEFTEFIFQDIARDGTLSGPRLGVIEVVCSLGLSVIIAGGISSIDDIYSLASLARRTSKKALKGVIVGRALYDGRICLGEAIEAGLGRPIISKSKSGGSLACTENV